MIAVTGGLLGLAQLPAIASPAGTTITIAAKSKLKQVTGFVFVKWRQGSDATATIHGSITGGQPVM
jgi:hypothetical protein